MNVLKKPAPPTAPEVAYRWLRDAITGLPWDEEAYLSENAVADATGTSRTPVREALLRLEFEGLIRRVPHRGAHVPPLSERDIESVLEARTVIEQWAVRKVTGSNYSTDKLEELLARQADSLADPVEFIRCDIEFYKDIVAAAGNPVLEDLYRSLRHKELRMGKRAVRGSDGRRGYSLAEHRAVVRTIRSGDPHLAVDTTDCTVTSIQSQQ